jgi:hypothetical protein
MSEQVDDPAEKYSAKFRLVVGALMAICWAVLIVF